MSTDGGLKSGPDRYVRLNKRLAELGFCSRREADRLINSGLVTVNGWTAGLGTKVSASDSIEVKGKTIADRQKSELMVIALNKPRGVVCTASDKDRAPNVVDLIGLDARVVYIGRLDKDSEGLILLTNIGELVDLVGRGRYLHEKEYVVEVSRPIDESFIKRVCSGMMIKVPGRGWVRTRPCEARIIDEHCFRIVLTEGMNRQIRRMCEALGNKVRSLTRIRVLNIELGSLKTGEWRYLTKEELARLFSMVGYEAPARILTGH